jgi:hypothetical protein
MPSTTQRLRDLRHELLQLHRALIQNEKLSYERSQERLVSGSELFKLMLYDERFAWLRPMSALIVRIDEVLELERDVERRTEGAAVWQEAARLFKPSNDDASFGRRYYELLQQSPDLASMHARVRQELGREL